MPNNWIRLWSYVEFYKDKSRMLNTIRIIKRWNGWRSANYRWLNDDFVDKYRWLEDKLLHFLAWKDRRTWTHCMVKFAFHKRDKHFLSKNLLKPRYIKENFRCPPAVLTGCLHHSSSSIGWMSQSINRYRSRRTGGFRGTEPPNIIFFFWIFQFTTNVGFVGFVPHTIFFRNL